MKVRQRKFESKMRSLKKWIDSLDRSDESKARMLIGFSFVWANHYEFSFDET